MSDTSHEHDVCVMPVFCGRERQCWVEVRRLLRGEDLGQLHAPPCFVSLLRSLYEVETVRQGISRRAGNDA